MAPEDKATASKELSSVHCNLCEKNITAKLNICQGKQYNYPHDQLLSFVQGNLLHCGAGSLSTGLRPISVLYCSRELHTLDCDQDEVLTNKHKKPQGQPRVRQQCIAHHSTLQRAKEWQHPDIKT